jgi:hypothetical protein
VLFDEQDSQRMQSCEVSKLFYWSASRHNGSN